MKKTKLLILASPRTGSNWLCDLLTNQGEFGNVKGFDIGYGAGLANIFNRATKSYVEKNSGTHFGCKVMWDYLDHLSQYASPLDVQSWLQSFDKYIQLYRKDIAAQAVSHYIAQSSKQYHEYDKATGDPIPYDKDHIAWLYQDIVAQNKKTQTYFDLYNITPLRISYETLAKNTQGTLTAILEFCGLDIHKPPTIKSKYKKQTDPLKDKFIVQFRKDTGI